MNDHPRPRTGSGAASHVTTLPHGRPGSRLGRSLGGAQGISRAGAAWVLLITTITLGAAFFGGIVYDAALAFGDASGLGAWGAFTHPNFWPVFWEVVPSAWPDYKADFSWALAFGALGSWATIRAAYAMTGTGAAAVPDDDVSADQDVSVDADVPVDADPTVSADAAPDTVPDADPEPTPDQR